MAKRESNDRIPGRPAKYPSEIPALDARLPHTPPVNTSVPVLDDPHPRRGDRRTGHHHRLPTNLDPVDAATLPLNAQISAQRVRRLGPASRRTLLITGTARAAGGYAVTPAAQAGWTVTSLTRNPNRDFFLKVSVRA